MRPARRPLRAQAQVDACTECATLHAELVSLATVDPPAPGDRAAAGLPAPAGGRPAAAPEPLPSPVRIVRDGPRRLQPAAAMGLTTLGHRRADARDPARHAVVRWRRERPESASRPHRLRSRRIQTFGAAAPSAPAPAAGGAPEAQPGASTPAESSGGLRPRRRHDRSTRTSRRSGSTSATTSDYGAADIAGEPQSLTSVADDSTGVSQLVVISGTLLIVGLGLFALRWTSRRFGG